MQSSFIHHISLESNIPFFIHHEPLILNAGFLDLWRVHKNWKHAFFMHLASPVLDAVFFSFIFSIIKSKRSQNRYVSSHVWCWSCCWMSPPGMSSGSDCTAQNLKPPGNLFSLFPRKREVEDLGELRLFLGNPRHFSFKWERERTELRYIINV